MPDHASQNDDAPALVPASLPPILRELPAPVRTVPGLFALPGMVLLWFFPKATGVRLAHSGWIAALAAHLFALTIGLGLVAWAFVYPWANPAGMAPVTFDIPGVLTDDVNYPPPAMSMSEILRAPVVSLVTLVHSTTPLGGLPRVAGIIAAFEAFVVLLALLMMPYAAAGESKPALFGRCLRLALWSTTLLIPIGIVVLLTPMLCRWLRFSPNEWTSTHTLVVLALGWWWLIVLWRSSRRYAGPAEGPGWDSRFPRCERCGYNIAQIPIATNCPECGYPVADSLPNRRVVPEFVVANGTFELIRSFCRTTRRISLQRDFLERLSIHRDPRRDRTYFVITALLTALLLSLWPLVTLFADEPLGFTFVTSLYLTSITIAFWLQLIVAASMAVLVSLAGKRTMQSAAIWSYYAIGYLFRIIGFLLLFAGGLISIWIASDASDPSITTVGRCVVIAVAAILLACGGYSARRTIRSIRRALVATRYANA